jgi:hypothetical protein
VKKGEMLISVYIIGFVFGGLVLFAVAQRIPNRKAKIWLKTIGVLAGPIFFLSVVVFSGWVRERTYEVEWLTGNSAAKYLDPGKKSTRQDRDVVVLRRFVGGNDCYEAFISQELADYFGGLPTHTIQVQYTVTYDFFQFRTYTVKRIGNLSYHPNGSSWITGGNNIGRACFPW